MITFYPLILPSAIGLLIAIHLISESSLPHKWLLSLSLMAPLGLGVTSLILFWNYVFYPAGAKNNSILTAWLLFILLFTALFRSNGASGSSQPLLEKIKSTLSRIRNFRPTPVSGEKLFDWILTSASFLLFAGLFIYFVEFYISKEAFNIHGGWDAKYYWNLKAKFFTRSPESWRAMFSPLLLPTDYPLMLPGTVAWGWNWLGSEAYAWPPIAAFAMTMSTILLVLWYLGSYVSPVNALISLSFLFTLNAFQFWSATLYADLPLCFYITASVLLLRLALDSGSKTLLILCGIFAGLAAWTKNEGIPFLAMITFVSNFLIWRNQHWTKKNKIHCSLSFICAAVIPLASSLTIKTVFSHYTGYFDPARNKPVIEQFLLGNFFTIRLTFQSLIENMIKHTQWSLLWYLFPLSLVYFLARNHSSLFRNHSWITPAFVIFIFCEYFAFLSFTPPFMVIHILKFATPRLIVHPSILALIFIFEAAGPPSLFSQKRNQD